MWKNNKANKDYITKNNKAIKANAILKGEFSACVIILSYKTQPMDMSDTKPVLGC